MSATKLSRLSVKHMGMTSADVVRDGEANRNRSSCFLFAIPTRT